MILTSENYYSREANEEYLSSTQYKSFMDCEARSLAELRGEYEPEEKEAYLVGNYLHSYFSGDLEKFVSEHPEIISSRGATKGDLKAPFKLAQDMVDVLADDQKAMFYLQGRSEVPIIGEIYGVRWKGKADKINDGLNYILDLKTTKSINEFAWSTKLGKRVSFIEQYDYFVQVAVYSELERQMRDGKEWKDFYMLAVSKEKHPDHALIDCTDKDRVAAELEQIKANQGRIVKIKKGEIEPVRCNHCEYCRATKRIDKPVWYGELREV
jgi:hypothetical protein